ncbi:MAG: transposase [Bacteroidales bacterium]|nr:transposase [Bacteroidales bacterium]
MKFIKGENRTQINLFPVSLEHAINEDNEVRIIDLFVDSVSLEDYGYLNKVRSSRDLEKECKRNIEVMWLLKNLKPDHNTISNFRQDNPKAINKVFRATVQIAKNFNLIGGKLIAGDSTKFRTHNSKNIPF